MDASRASNNIPTIKICRAQCVATERVIKEWARGDEEGVPRTSSNTAGAMAAVCIGAGCCSGQGRSIACERDSSSKYAVYSSKRLNGKVGKAGSRRRPRFWCCNAAAAANNSDPRPDAFDLWKTAAGYHPLEELSSSEKEEMEKIRGGKLSDGETARTITEVNTNAILLAPALSHSNSVFGTPVTYLVDEHGEIYFELPDDSDVLQNLFVNPTCSFLIGFGELNELLTSELLPAYENHLVAENEDDTFEEDELLGSEDDSEEDEDDLSDSDDSDDSQEPHDVHPIVFASKLAKVAASDVLKNIYKPSLRLAMTGVVRSVSEEEEPYVRRKWEDRYFWEDDGSNEEDEDEEEQNEDEEEEEGDTKTAAEDVVAASSDSSSESEDWTDSSESETSFYKFEIDSIQLTSDLGAHASVDVKEFGYSEPDVLAHAAPEIMKRLNSGGKKIKRALKTLCHREKGLTIEEATIIGVDSLGMDVRASCGLELRTIRVPFIRRARCADTAQLLLHQLLYPRSRHKK